MDVDLDTGSEDGVRSHKQPRAIEVENDSLVGAIPVMKFTGDSALYASDGSSFHRLQSLGRNIDRDLVIDLRACQVDAGQALGRTWAIENFPAG
jgi:hypothetical protein